jgi:hypothetical protein
MSEVVQGIVLPRYKRWHEKVPQNSYSTYYSGQVAYFQLVVHLAQHGLVHCQKTSVMSPMAIGMFSFFYEIVPSKPEIVLH